MMNYNEVINFMYNSLPMYQRQGKAAYKADLKNTVLLDEYFKQPHKYFKSIHIAGTNGKGSVAHILASVFRESGYKTGLYTSPHLIDYRERIKINGKKISKNFVCDFINSNYEIIKKIKPSFFEMSVALAFEYFKQQKVDVAIIEVGMGGRLDSTNIITPLLSVITNIGLDHTYFLGDNLEKIAQEKAGIIKSNIPVIIGETNEITKKVFIKSASEKKSEILFADKKINLKYNGNMMYCQYKPDKSDYKCKPDLKGKYQEKNFRTALLALIKLKTIFGKITNSSVVKGFENVIKNTDFRGRWETISTKPLVICDTAHNKEGLEIVIKQIKELKYSKLHIVMGFVNDKNIRDILQVFPENAIYYFTQANIPRALKSEILKNEAEKFNLKGNSFANIEEAYNTAKTNLKKNDMIFVGGSTFVVGEFLEKKQLSLS